MILSQFKLFNRTALVVLLLIITVSACSDPNVEANKAGILAKKTYDEYLAADVPRHRLTLIQSVDSKLREIVSEYPGSTLATTIAAKQLAVGIPVGLVPELINREKRAVDLINRKTDSFISQNEVIEERWESLQKSLLGKWAEFDWKDDLSAFHYYDRNHDSQMFQPLFNSIANYKYKIISVNEPRRILKLQITHTNSGNQFYKLLVFSPGRTELMEIRNEEMIAKIEAGGDIPTFRLAYKFVDGKTSVRDEFINE